MRPHWDDLTPEDITESRERPVVEDEEDDVKPEEADVQDNLVYRTGGW